MGDVLGARNAPSSPERLLTIGIPVFNGRSLLRNCLQSVVNSTLPRARFEILVADDGSTEPETLAILADFEDSLAADPGFFRVIWLGANSGGAARPRNCILDGATGEYVFFVDSDDTIGALTLERIAEALATAPADWVALNQVPVNGRDSFFALNHERIQASRAQALATLTVHKVFRRAEIERQQLRFDEQLPSGQDVAFAFSYILNAARFLMLGGYDYYYLTQHVGNPNEPGHLSRRASTPVALIDKNERILRSLLEALRTGNVSDSERRHILSRIVLPRVLVQQGHLKAVVNVGPDVGGRALRRLSLSLAEPLAAGIEPAALRGLTEEHLAVIAKSDWPALAQLVHPSPPQPPSRVGLPAHWASRGRHLVDVASGRARHRRVIHQLELLRTSLEEVEVTQRRLETTLQAQFGPGNGDAREPAAPGGAGPADGR